ncbi:MAG: hypothetical protein Q9187_007248 [Circinaria calcarea]
MRNASSRLWAWPLRITCLAGLLLLVYSVIFYHSNINFHPKTKHGKDIQKHTKPPLDAHALDYRIAHLKEIAEWQKPEGMRRNLVENGGILDEIVFLAKTDDKDDLAYLEELLASNPNYSAEYHNQQGFDYSQMWSVCKKGNIYVKIDDDVVRVPGLQLRTALGFLLTDDSSSLKIPRSARL